MRKLVLVSAASLLSFGAFAANIDQSLYNALNVTPVNTAQGVGFAILKKEVKGLVCTRSAVVYPNAVPTYACTITPALLDSAEVYTALNAEESDIYVSEAYSGLEKTAGSLTCRKTPSFTAEAKFKYSCALGLRF